MRVVDVSNVTDKNIYPMSANTLVHGVSPQTVTASITIPAELKISSFQFYNDRHLAAGVNCTTEILVNDAGIYGTPAGLLDQWVDFNLFNGIIVENAKTIKISVRTVFAGWAGANDMEVKIQAAVKSVEKIR